MAIQKYIAAKTFEVNGTEYTPGKRIKKDDISGRLIRARKIKVAPVTAQPTKPVKIKEEIKEIKEPKEVILTEISSDVKLVKEIVEDGVIDKKERGILGKLFS